MSTLKWLKKTCIGCIGLMLAIPRWGIAEENKEQVEPTPAPKQEQEVKAQFSKEDLINSLRQININPKSIKAIGAMCYEMMVPPKEVEFQCGICGHTAIYARESDPGALTNSLPYIKRSLATMPYKISIDSSGLCPICGKGKDKVLSMHVSCFSCGKEFSWEVKNQKDIDMLKWLYIKPPVTELDATNLRLWVDTEKGIKEGAKYIQDHVFCPVCREKINL